MISSVSKCDHGTCLVVVIREGVRICLLILVWLVEWSLIIQELV
jgi:hypothetical protein